MDNPIVKTVEGKLRGCTRINLDNEEFYCFFGIPYAKPALGELRFKAPQTIEPWSGIRNALRESQPFIQTDTFTQTTSNVFGTEDALHLSVYTKKPIPDSSHLNPVMVWIHGGGYVEGHNNTSLYGPDYILTEDIVLVCINYRLGVFGFLSFEDPSLEIYGNAGMKDQVEALKWVQRNIKQFGGNPDNVTIFGESAGSVSVHCLMTSPLAQELFHKGIMQSGCLLNGWAKGTRFVKDFMKYIGKESLTEREMLKYLRNLPVDELFDYQNQYFDSLITCNLGAVGPIEEIPNNTAFMTKFSQEDNIVPVMLGYTSNEAMLLASDKIKHFSKLVRDFNGIDLIIKFLNLDIEESKAEILDKKLKELYTTEDDLYLMLSDTINTMGIIAAGKQFSKTSGIPVYLYRLSLDTKMNLLKRRLKLEHLKGACHIDDCGYLFSNDLIPPPEKNTVEYTSVKKMIKLWTNFAKFGNPTPDEKEFGVTWKPVDKDTLQFLDIDRDLKAGMNPENERVKLWKEIFQASSNTADYF